MKFLKAFLICVLCFILMASGVSAKTSEKINWFFKSRGENEQPEILGGNDIAEKYGALYMGDEGDKTVYLTFDAGYSNENVEKILDILARRQIRAAFFILPGIIKNSPETVKKMEADGHLICNHSTSHGDMSKIDDISEFEKELKGVEEIYADVTGFEMEKYFRPPEGSFSENTLEFCKELGYIPVFWSFAYADWDNGAQMPSEKALNKILSSVHDGAVILLHPTSKTNADILESVILRLQEQGYTFGTLDELAEKKGLI